MIHGLFAEYCNAVFKMEVQFYERFEWKVFHNTHKSVLTLYICLENLPWLKN